MQTRNILISIFIGLLIAVLMYLIGRELGIFLLFLPFVFLPMPFIFHRGRKPND